MRLLRESWKRELLSEEGKTTEDFKKDLDVKWKIDLFASNNPILKPVTIPKVSSELNSGIIESKNQFPKFSEIIPEYLNFMRKNKRRLSSIDKTEVSYQDFIEIVGDKPISDFTRNDARDYRNIISKLPKNRRKLKNYRDKLINELLKMEIPDSHILNI